MSTNLSRMVKKIGFKRAFVTLGFAMFFAIAASGGGEAQSPMSLKSSPVASTDAGSLIETTVIDLQGSTAITSGGISIDFSRATIFSTVTNEIIDSSAIKIGSRISVSVQIPADSASPFVAQFVNVRSNDEITLVAAVEGLDLENNAGVIGTLRAGHQRFHFSGGTLLDFGPGYKKLKAGRLVTIIAFPDGHGDFIATRVFINLQNPGAIVGF